MQVNNIDPDSALCICNATVINYIDYNTNWCYVDHKQPYDVYILTRPFTDTSSYVMIIVDTLSEEDKLLITLKNDYIKQVASFEGLLYHNHFTVDCYR